jgi:hypothetical protein
MVTTPVPQRTKTTSSHLPQPLNCTCIIPCCRPRLSLLQRLPRLDSIADPLRKPRLRKHLLLPLHHILRLCKLSLQLRTSASISVTCSDTFSSTLSVGETDIIRTCSRTKSIHHASIAPHTCASSSIMSVLPLLPHTSLSCLTLLQPCDFTANLCNRLSGIGRESHHKESKIALAVSSQL